VELVLQGAPEPLGQGDGEAHLAAVHDVVGQMGFQGLLEHVLALGALELVVHRQAGDPFHELVVQEGHPHLQGVGHAGPVHLGEDVAHHVGFHVQVLHLGDRVAVPHRGAGVVAAQHLHRPVAVQALPEGGAEDLVAQVVAHDRDAVEIALHRVPGHGLEGGLGAQHLGRPVRLGVGAAQEAEQGLAHPVGQQVAHAFLVAVPAVAAVAGEVLVAAVAGQGHGHVLAGQLADPVGGHGGGIGVGLVVQAGQFVHQADVVGFHQVDVVVGA
jgi:hypothetical protein